MSMSVQIPMVVVVRCVTTVLDLSPVAAAQATRSPMMASPVLTSTNVSLMLAGAVRGFARTPMEATPVLVARASHWPVMAGLV